MNGVSCDREPVAELHQHLGPAGLRRVHAAGDVVDRLRGLQQLLRLLLGRPPRIGQLRDLRLVLVERLDRRLVGDRDEDHVAPFLALADRPHRHAIRRLVDGGEVAMDVGRPGQLARRARHVAEELQRRRHRVGRRQVIDELGRDPRILEVLLDLRGVLGVDLLLLWRRRRAPAPPDGSTRDRQRGRQHQRKPCRANKFRVVVHARVYSTKWPGVCFSDSVCWPTCESR